MPLIDTHSHIYLEDFDEDIERVIESARLAGITRILLPNIDSDSVGRMHRLCDQYPYFCFPMMGLHPTSVKSDSRKELTLLRTFFDQRKYIAVGEIGIDLYWDTTFLEEQMAVFKEQLRWGVEMDLPVVIHCRSAFSEVMKCLYEVGVDQLRGVFHSFGGSREELEEIISLENFMIGINGVVTFKNSVFREYLSLAPIQRIIVETDAPYLAPVPYRGKRNEPAYLLYTGQKLAEVYGLELEEVARITTSNALRLFDLPNDF